MAGPLSNPVPRSDTNAYPGSVPTKVRRAGTTQRPSIPVKPTTRGRSATMTGVGTEDKNPPESGRARQDAANGTVHGQPRSGYNAGDNASPIPNRGS